MTKNTRALKHDGVIIAIHIGEECMAAAVCLIPSQRTLKTPQASVRAVREYPGQDPVLERVPTRVQYSKGGKIVAVGAQADKAARIAWRTIIDHDAYMYLDVHGNTYHKPQPYNAHGYDPGLTETTAALLGYMAEHAFDYAGSLQADAPPALVQRLRSNVHYVLSSASAKLKENVLRKASDESFNKDIKAKLHFVPPGGARARHWLLSSSPAFTGAHIIVCRLGLEPCTVVHTVTAETPRITTNVNYNRPIKANLYDDVRTRCDAEVRRRILGARGSAATTLVALKELQNRMFNMVCAFSNDGKNRALALAPDFSDGVPDSKQYSVHDGQMHFLYLDLAALFNDILAAVQNSLYGALAMQKQHDAPTNVYLLGLGPTNSPYFSAALQARMGSAVVCTLVRGQDMEAMTAKGAATLFFDAQHHVVTV